MNSGSNSSFDKQNDSLSKEELDPFIHLLIHYQDPRREVSSSGNVKARFLAYLLFLGGISVSTYFLLQALIKISGKLAVL